MKYVSPACMGSHVRLVGYRILDSIWKQISSLVLALVLVLVQVVKELEASSSSRRKSQRSRTPRWVSSLRSVSS